MKNSSMNNAILSRAGGPQTPEGKLVASRNSLKTGVYSKLIVLPGEDEEQFRDLEAQFNHDFAPQDIAEAAMVHELAILTWKKIRLEQLEYRVIKHSLDKKVGEYDLRNTANYTFRAGAKWILEIIDDLTQDLYQLHGKRILDAQAILDGTYGVNALNELKKLSLDLYQRVNNLANEYDLEDQTHDGIQNTLSPHGHVPVETFLRFALGEIVEESQDVIWGFENLEDIKAAIQKVKDDRFIYVMQNQTTSRASDDLGRAFFRTLAELRKQKHWRYQRHAIDITTTINESRNQIENGNPKKS